MREGPIIMTGESVRAILEKRKWQTRRPLKPQPAPDATGRWTYIASSTDRRSEGKFCWSVLDTDGHTYTERGRETSTLYACPYGQIGQILWVKETYGFLWEDAEAKYQDAVDNCVRYAYKASGQTAYRNFWKSPRFMPRAASRLLLEITNVRIERLQAITEEDAIAEGQTAYTLHFWSGFDENGGMVDCGAGQQGEMPAPEWMECARLRTYTTSAYDRYSSEWNRINGRKVGLNWQANPWVIALDFKEVTP